MVKGVGKYWEPKHTAARIEVTIESIEVEMPEQVKPIIEVCYAEYKGSEYIAPRKYPFALISDLDGVTTFISWKANQESGESAVLQSTNKYKRMKVKNPDLVVPTFHLVETKIRT